ncbi:MAG: DNA replication and repair protein RecF [Bacteroidia bacterium]|nr:DNA replication and repair protein RecF [Bacteroidia bacterium]
MSLRQFKNHRQADFDFCPEFNCFYGENGVGKTNVLDALHFISNGRSYFSRTDVNSIQFEEDFALIEAVVANNDERVNLRVGLQRNGKKGIHKNGVMVKRLADFVGHLPGVMITPGDITMLTGTSDERRRFVDKTIGFSDPEYLRILIRHNKLLESRNELLKQFYLNRYTDLLALEAIDHQLAPAMDYIKQRRTSFLTEIKPHLVHVYEHMVEANESLSISLTSHLEEKTGFEVLQEAQKQDLYAQRTTSGCHKDDLDVLIDDVSVRKFGSQGQIKSATIALNLAAYLYLSEKLGRKPLLLLDDIFEKIDEHRARRLLGLISSQDFGQIFITDTSEERLKSKLQSLSSEKKFFNIERP